MNKTKRADGGAWEYGELFKDIEQLARIVKDNTEELHWHVTPLLFGIDENTREPSIVMMPPQTDALQQAQQMLRFRLADMLTGIGMPADASLLLSLMQKDNHHAD